jgi:hypothetical protein
MNTILLFCALRLTSLTQIPGSPTYHFGSMTTCEETMRHPAVQASYGAIYGDGVVMVCVPVAGTGK